MEKKGTFDTLDKDAKLFKNLKELNPDWWNLLRNDEELYIEIRKDNYINVYYYGGSIAKIYYKKDFIAETYQKYLGYSKPLSKSKDGKGKFIYSKIDLGNFNAKVLTQIKKRIFIDYLKQSEKESPAEKWIQGKLKINNPKYIDSEFQFNQDIEIGKLRIDLIELNKGVLTFVELKGISDSRLRNDKKRNKEVPEIVSQMDKYQKFVNKYSKGIKKYYKNLLQIKKDLKIISDNNTNEISVNLTPLLLIANTYKKTTIGREERIKDINDLLSEHNIKSKTEIWR